MICAIAWLDCTRQLASSLIDDGKTCMVGKKMGFYRQKCKI